MTYLISKNYIFSKISISENRESNLLGHHLAHIVGIQIGIGHLVRRWGVYGQILDLAPVIKLRHRQPKKTQTKLNKKL